MSNLQHKPLQSYAQADTSFHPVEKPDETLEDVTARYAYRITGHIQKMIEGQPENSPIARQYLPRLEELNKHPEENSDPIGDEAHTPVKGVVHRHTDRVLLKLANICAVYCRFCFRREMVGPGADILNPAERTTALKYIAAHPEIQEVILTGGDPLILSPRQLSETLEALDKIDHIRLIRIHTRIPIADPQRITPDLCKALSRKKAVYIALHINHPHEITPDVENAVSALLQTGSTLLSQSVLLKDINDDTQILEDLFRKLTALKIKPYYLHHPDLAPGTGHFRLSLKEGRALVKKLHGHLSGIYLPTYMLDIPGGYGKVPINNDYITELEDGTYIVEDYQGQKHSYPPKEHI